MLQLCRLNPTLVNVHEGGQFLSARTLSDNKDTKWQANSACISNDNQRPLNASPIKPSESRSPLSEIQNDCEKGQNNVI